MDSSKLDIESVETDDGKSLKFHIGDEVPNYGSKLTITLDSGLQSGAKWVYVHIFYNSYTYTFTYMYTHTLSRRYHTFFKLFVLLDR